VTAVLPNVVAPGCGSVTVAPSPIAAGTIGDVAYTSNPAD